MYNPGQCAGAAPPVETGDRAGAGECYAEAGASRMRTAIQPEIAAEPVEAPEADLPDIDYPYSDGVAMSESDFQAWAIINARHFLGTHFRDRPDVYVSGNIFVYFNRANLSENVSPDILVAFGVERRRRRSYRTWEEGKAPDFVLEVLSPSTWKRDLDKRKTYARLGVEEYFVFDPTGDFIQPMLQGYRLDWGTYSPMPGLEPLAVRSRVLGLDLWVDEGRDLRMRDAATGENLWSPEESEACRRKAEGRAERAEARAEQAEARAEQAETRAENAEIRADEETRRRLAAEERLAEFEQRLKSSR
ncbi:MAG: Uma2 family endonuclease [Bryobacterales bacterium]|nr:Uma2 family endonuclease [Bryobacterales bacterium]